MEILSGSKVDEIDVLLGRSDSSVKEELGLSEWLVASNQIRKWNNTQTKTVSGIRQSQKKMLLDD